MCFLDFSNSFKHIYFVWLYTKITSLLYIGSQDMASSTYIQPLAFSHSHLCLLESKFCAPDSSTIQTSPMPTPTPTPLCPTATGQDTRLSSASSNSRNSCCSSSCLTMPRRRGSYPMDCVSPGRTRNIRLGPWHPGDTSDGLPPGVWGTSITWPSVLLPCLPR